MDCLLRHELRRLKQELQHLIYPLNYAANCSHLSLGQESFFDLYEQDWRAFTEQLLRQNREDSTFLSVDAQVEELCAQLSHEDRLRLLGETLISLLSRCCAYDARLRELMLRVAERLHVSRTEFMSEIEEGIVDYFEEQAVIEAAPPPESAKKWSTRKWLLATAGELTGAAACSLSAGIAAPFFLPTLASAVGLTAAGSGGVAVMATVFGVAGAGMAGWRVSRRFAGIKDFQFVPLRDRERNRSFRVVIAVSGWLGDRVALNKTPSAAWIAAYLEKLDAALFEAEFYCLSFESEILRNFGNSLRDFLKSTAVTVAAAQILRFTVTAASTTALMLPLSVLQAGDLIDNPWTLGVDRARKAGKALAEALRFCAQGR